MIDILSKYLHIDQRTERSALLDYIDLLPCAEWLASLLLSPAVSRKVWL